MCRAQVFAGAAGALFVMTILSVLFGWAAPNLIPEIYTHYAAIALFFFFGLKNIWDFINYKPEVRARALVSAAHTQSSRQ